MSFLMNFITACFRPKKKYSNVDTRDALLAEADPEKNAGGVADDPLLWQCPLAKHALGTYSFCVVQANTKLEDYAEVQCGPLGTFVGVYDGHGGSEAADFLQKHLYRNLQKSAAPLGCVTPAAIKEACAATDSEFLASVRSQWLQKPSMAAVGSCCLLACVTPAPNPSLLVASVGDSRGVLGTTTGSSGKGPPLFAAVQMSRDHNANDADVRAELHRKFPEESEVVVQKSGVWRVKGIIQVSRSFGDFYLKLQEFQTFPLLARFLLPAPLTAPLLNAEPTVVERALKAGDRFLILASDGLWEHLSNEKAVELVPTVSKEGAARRLVVAALREAARKRNGSYAEVKELGAGRRRPIHDDITCVVLFFELPSTERGGSEAAPTPNPIPTLTSLLSCQPHSLACNDTPEEGEDEM